MKIYRNEVQIEKICRILQNLRKTFFNWKKIQLQVPKSGVFGGFGEQKSFFDFLFFFLEMKFRQKKFAVFWKIGEKLFFTEKNPTSSSKIGGFGGQKMFSDFLGVFLEMKFRWNKCAVIWEICEKLFFTGKNSNFFET